MPDSIEVRRLHAVEDIAKNAEDVFGRNSGRNPIPKRARIDGHDIENRPGGARQAAVQEGNDVFVIASKTEVEFIARTLKPLRACLYRVQYLDRAKHAFRIQRLDHFARGSCPALALNSVGVERRSENCSVPWI